MTQARPVATPRYARAFGYAPAKAPELMQYGLALGAIGVATVFTYVARPYLQHTTVAAFLAALVVISWYLGRRPAFLALAAAIVAIEFVAVPESASLRSGSPGYAIPFAVVATLGLLFIFVSDRAHNAESQLRRALAELEEQAGELEQQMDSAQALQIELEVTNDQLESANRELDSNREFLEQAQRSAHLGSWDWDVTEDVVTWSDELFRVYGVEPRSIPVNFESFLERVHPDDREMVALTVGSAMEKAEPFSFDHRVVLPDGRIRWLAAEGRVETDAQGRTVRLTGSGQDITERRRAAEAQRFLAEAGELLSSSLDYQATLRTLANLAVREIADWCSIAVGDQSGRYENIAVAHRDPDKVLWAEEWARAHPPRFDTPTGVPNVLRTGEPEVYPEITPELLRRTVESPEELRAIEQLGLYSAMVVPMNARGRTIGAITFISAESRYRFTSDDLWLARRLAGRAALAIDNARLFEEATSAREVAEHANRAKTDFLAAMSHEFRTPLNAIAGYSELLELGVYGALTAQQRDVLARLKRSEGLLLALVEEVLGFARIEAGKVRYDLKRVVLADVVERASEMTMPQMEAKKLGFSSDVSAEIVVLADADRLEQILINLLSNAMKFTETGGRVSVASRPDGGFAILTVSDTGVGIPPDKLEVVFEPFAQLPHASAKRSSGVGLGLAISRDLARAMGGDVSVSSTVAVGSTFTLSLPLAPA